MKRLVLHEGRTRYPHHLFGPDSTTAIEAVKANRDIFVVNLKIALIILMRNRVGNVPWQACVAKTEAELLESYPHRYAETELPSQDTPSSDPAAS